MFGVSNQVAAAASWGDETTNLRSMQNDISGAINRSYNISGVKPNICFVSSDAYSAMTNATNPDNGISIAEYQTLNGITFIPTRFLNNTGTTGASAIVFNNQGSDVRGYMNLAPTILSGDPTKYKEEELSWAIAGWSVANEGLVQSVTNLLG